MVHTDRDDLAVVDMAFFYPGQMVVSALDPGGQVGSSRVWTGWLTWSTNSDKVVVARAVSPSRLHHIMSSSRATTSHPGLARSGPRCVHQR
jgi:hypothetical protein